MPQCDHASPRTAVVTAGFKAAVVTEVSQFIPFTLERTSKYDGALHNDFDGVGVVGDGSSWYAYRGCNRTCAAATFDARNNQALQVQVSKPCLL